MKKIFIVTLCIFIGFVASAQTNSITGIWVLSKIDANGTVTVPVEKSRSAASSSDKPDVSFEKKTIPAAEHLKKEMSIGVTKFVFTATGFEFYRKEKLTFGGTYTFDGYNLVLNYTHNNSPNVKESKVVSITLHDMVMESQSMGNKVLLSFSKSK